MPTNGQYAVGELVTASDANTVFSRGNQNAIINGDFFVNQRGFANSGSGALDAFGLDRWKIVSTGGATWTPQTFTPGNAISGYEPVTFSRIVTSGQSGSSVYSIITQPVEDVRTFAGQTTTLSFWAKANSGIPKIAVELAQVFGSGGSPSASANYYAGQITLSTSWTRHTLQIAVPSITGKTIGTTANTSYVALQLWVSAGSSFDTRTGSLGIQTNTFDIWGVQWETGQVASPFQIPDRMNELAQCQRYFVRFPGQSAANYNQIGSAGIVANTTTVNRLALQLPVAMRRNIATADFTYDAGALTLYDGSALPAVTSHTIYSTSPTTISMDMGATAGGLSANRPAVLLTTSSVASGLSITAEF